METIKELVVDALVLVGAWLVVTATGLHNTGKGLTCGRDAVETTQAKHP